MIVCVIEYAVEPGMEARNIEMVQMLLPVVAEIDGFISKETFDSRNNPGKILTISILRASMPGSTEYSMTQTIIRASAQSPGGDSLREPTPCAALDPNHHPGARVQAVVIRRGQGIDAVRADHFFRSLDRIA